MQNTESEVLPVNRSAHGAWRAIGCIFLWMLTIGWLALIFYLTGQNGTSSSELSMRISRFISERILHGRIAARTLNPYLRKLAHFGIFAVEGFLLVLALGASMRKKAVPVFMTVFVCIAMAALSELQQTIAEGRAASILDVGIDSAGAVLGIFAAWILLALFQHPRRQKKHKNLS